MNLTGYFQKNWFVFALLAIVAFVCYGVVVNGPFILDDEHFIEKNINVRDFKIAEIYKSSVTQGAYIAGNFYRPNQQLIFAVICKFFDTNPVPYHLFSILLHLINAFLVFRLILYFDLSRIAAFIGSLLYLIHPIQTEAVSYVSGLADLLAFFFLLSGLIVFNRGLKQQSGKPFLNLLGASVLFILALFSKENMVILLPLSLVVLYYFYGTKKIPVNKYIMLSLGVFGVLAFGYLILKFTVFNFSDSVGLTTDKNKYTDHLHIRIFTFFNVIIEYVKMIFFPERLNYEKPYTAYDTMWTARALVAYLVFGIFAYATWKIKKMPRVFLGLGWFLAALLPYTGVVPLNAMFLEHWLYVPMVGVAILLAALWDKMAKHKVERVLIVVLVPVFLALTVRTYSRNVQWADIEKFYLNELKYTNSAIRVYNNLGMHYSDKGELNKAIRYYQLAIKKLDTYPQPHHNLANLYFEQGKNDLGIRELYRALSIDPNFIYSLGKLHQVFMALKQPEKAAQVEAMMQNVQNGGRNNFEDIKALMLVPAKVDSAAGN